MTPVPSWRAARALRAHPQHRLEPVLGTSVEHPDRGHDVVDVAGVRIRRRPAQVARLLEQRQGGRVPSGIELEHALHVAHVGQDQVASRASRAARQAPRPPGREARAGQPQDARRAGRSSSRTTSMFAASSGRPASRKCRRASVAVSSITGHVVDRDGGLAVPLVEGRELVGPEVPGQVGDRAAVELERLAPARDGARGARPGQCRPVGLRAQAGPLEVHRRVDLRRADQQRPELGRAGVEVAQLGRPHGRVQRVPEELVAEVVEAAIEEIERDTGTTARPAPRAAPRGRRPDGPCTRRGPRARSSDR